MDCPTSSVLTVQHPNDRSKRFLLSRSGACINANMSCKFLLQVLETFKASFSQGTMIVQGKCSWYHVMYQTIYFTHGYGSDLAKTSTWSICNVSLEDVHVLYLAIMRRIILVSSLVVSHYKTTLVLPRTIPGV